MVKCCCPTCGYPAEGLVADLCPECGHSMSAVWHIRFGWAQLAAVGFVLGMTIGLGVVLAEWRFGAMRWPFFGFPFALSWTPYGGERLSGLALLLNVTWLLLTGAGAFALLIGYEIVRAGRHVCTLSSHLLWICVAIGLFVAIDEARIVRSDLRGFPVDVSFVGPWVVLSPFAYAANFFVAVAFGLALEAGWIIWRHRCRIQLHWSRNHACPGLPALNRHGPAPS